MTFGCVFHASIEKRIAFATPSPLILLMFIGGADPVVERTVTAVGFVIRADTGTIVREPHALAFLAPVPFVLCGAVFVILCVRSVFERAFVVVVSTVRARVFVTVASESEVLAFIAPTPIVLFFRGTAFVRHLWREKKLDLSS